MNRLYLTDMQTEQIFAAIRWLFLIVCGVLFYYEPFREQLNLVIYSFDYLYITGFSYMLISQIFLFISSKKEKLQAFIIRSGIIFDYIVLFWLIELSGGISSFFVPIIYLFLMHATIYWHKRGLIIAIVSSIMGYTAVGFFPIKPLTVDLLWTYSFNVVFIIIIGTFAGILALRERKQHKEKVTYQDLSVKDYITGLYNHRSFQNTLSKLVSSHKNFTLIMADIDDFKQINDKFGHTVGDQVLSAFGSTLQHQLDKSDSYSFRYGGEEFAVILFDDKKRSIENRINQWNKMFQQGMKLFSELDKEDITISFGVAFSEETDSKETLLKRADDYLYLAKSQGKDQIMFQESFERIGELK